DERLAGAGRGAGRGGLFGGFWVPVLLAGELPEPDGPPVRVTVLGEELLAFRDTRDRLGLIEPSCPHRGANLFFGRNEDCGIRCAYHGWKFDVEGACVALPTMARDEGMRSRVRLQASPAVEWCDLAWGYMGPPEHQPELPQLEFGLVPPEQRFVTKKLQQCNWAQSCEGALDTGHFSFLHTPLEVPELPPSVRDRPLAHAMRWMMDDPTPIFH